VELQAARAKFKEVQAALEELRMEHRSVSARASRCAEAEKEVLRLRAELQISVAKEVADRHSESARAAGHKAGEAEASARFEERLRLAGVRAAAAEDQASAAQKRAADAEERSSALDAELADRPPAEEVRSLRERLEKAEKVVAAERHSMEEAKHSAAQLAQRAVEAEQRALLESQRAEEMTEASAALELKTALQQQRLRQEAEDAAAKAAKELAELREQRAALQQELSNAFTKEAEATNRETAAHERAEASLQALRDEVKSLRAELSEKRMEVEAQRMVEYDRSREFTQLQFLLDERGAEVERLQLRLVMSPAANEMFEVPTFDKPTSRPQTPSKQMPRRGVSHVPAPPPSARRKGRHDSEPPTARRRPAQAAKHASPHEQQAGAQTPRSPQNAPVVHRPRAGTSKFRMATPSTAPPSDSEAAC